MSDLIDIEAAVGRDNHGPFWRRGMLRGARLAVAHPRRFPLVGRASLPPGTLLTFRDAGGDMDQYYAGYWIVQAAADQAEQILTVNDTFYLRGPLRILAHAQHDAGAKRERADWLRDWWEDWAPAHGGQIPPIARWLGDQIRRGVREPAEYPHPLSAADQAVRFDPVDGWDLGD